MKDLVTQFTRLGEVETSPVSPSVLVHLLTLLVLQQELLRLRPPKVVGV